MEILLCSFKKPGSIAVTLPVFVALMSCIGGCDSSDSQTGPAAVILLTIFVAPLIAGAIPLLGIRTHENLLRWATSLAAGFLISSALLVAVPGGFQLVSDEQSGRHVVHAYQKNSQEKRPSASTHHEIDELKSHDGLFRFGFHQAAGLALLTGFMLMLVVESLGFGHDLHEEHHHEGSQRDHIHHPAGETPKGRVLATPIVIGLTIHAVTDGLAMGAALATGSLALTTPLMFGIIMHKIPAALSLSAFSLHSHGNVHRIWRELLFFSLATPIALLICWRILGNVEKYWLGLAVLASAGTFLYVATVDVLPNVIHGGNRKMVLIQVFIGTALISSLLLVLESFGFTAHH